ncbi:MAG: DM13 domain-containing protein [Actinomycetota bacterium]
MKRILQNLFGTLMVLILAVSAAYSANFAGFRDALPPPSRTVNAGAIDRDPSTANDNENVSSLRSFPWWAPVEEFEGSGDTTTDRFEIDEFALQWRAVWKCLSGERLVVTARRPNGDVAGQPLVDDDCPAEGTGLSVEAGEFTLGVEADGAWELVIEEQVDVPLVEPLTPEMDKGRVIASAEIYDMDRKGEGTLAVYRLKDGSHMLRLEDFYISPNVDLEIDVSALKRPETTDEFFEARYEEIALMPVTTGSINYKIPDSIDLKDWQSIVVWCEPLHIAYAGATLDMES